MIISQFVVWIDGNDVYRGGRRYTIFFYWKYWRDEEIIADDDEFFCRGTENSKVASLQKILYLKCVWWFILGTHMMCCQTRLRLVNTQTHKISKLLYGTIHRYLKIELGLALCTPCAQIRNQFMKWKTIGQQKFQSDGRNIKYWSISDRCKHRNHPF